MNNPSSFNSVSCARRVLWMLEFFQYNSLCLIVIRDVNRVSLCKNKSESPENKDTLYLQKSARRILWSAIQQKGRKNNRNEPSVATGRLANLKNGGVNEQDIQGFGGKENVCLIV